MSDATPNSQPIDDASLEGPDVEVSTDAPSPAATGAAEHNSEGEPKADGLGAEGTIPNHPGGVAAGHTGVPSTFEPEEDEQA